ncbi:hypothetical protein DWQ67_07215 [Galactobacter caseinivorans]|uniref:DUF222 domain-containing protein n=1 Tax=Galactobacter caseinivorans TaxID=2676123 RepID=A0A496PK81_9MICC|nr:hypothetical protein DWQ67_07215 [Galactobacter caseinivorans]
MAGATLDQAGAAADAALGAALFADAEPGIPEGPVEPDWAGALAGLLDDAAEVVGADDSLDAPPPAQPLSTTAEATTRAASDRGLRDLRTMGPSFVKDARLAMSVDEVCGKLSRPGSLCGARGRA